MSRHIPEDPGPGSRNRDCRSKLSDDANHGNWKGIREGKEELADEVGLAE